MVPIRVHELAKELKVSSKEILEKMEKIGLEGKSHMSSLDHQSAERIRNFYRPVKIVEQRITAGVIRRRAKVEAPPAPSPEPVKPVEPRARPEEPIILAPGEAGPAPSVEEQPPGDLMPEPSLPTPVEEPAPVTASQPAIGGPVTEVPAAQQEVAAPEAGEEASKAIPRQRREFTLEEGVTPSVLRKKEDVRWKEDLRRGEPRNRRVRSFRPAGAPRQRRAAVIPIQAARKTELTTPTAIKRVVKMVEAITVGELAKRMGVKSGEVIKKLLIMGTMATINQALDADTASLIAHEFSYEVENVAFEPEVVLGVEEEVPEEKVGRPPVVTIMGHVDHGKTLLLDTIRKSNVVATEMGGITQHIGAYQVKLDRGQVTFLDTPGHEAFTAMRARGARVTDIVVLVVAADDGVMPQTVEAVSHARAAQVPIIVAVNKIDKSNADPQRVRQELSERGLVPEQWGGETVCLDVSAKKVIGIKELLEYILIQAEILELKANPKKMGKGTIIEAKLDKGWGPVATVLVQEGTLRVGDPFVCGIYYGRVRAMLNDLGERVEQAGPSTPVEVLGLSGVPEAGDMFRVVADERRAKEVSLYLRQKLREKELSKTVKLTLEELFSRAQRGEVKELNLVIKADVQGSLEALRESLVKQGTEAIKVKVIHGAAGSVTETDVMLARASDAIIIGFNVKPEAGVEAVAEQQGVDLRVYNVIYDAISDVKKAMEGLLEPTMREVVLGRAEVRQVFQISKVGLVAGCYVAEGKILRNCSIRLFREQAMIFEGQMASLKRFKDDVKEVAAGLECGISLQNFTDVKEGDTIEAFMVEKVPTKLE